MMFMKKRTHWAWKIYLILYSIGMLFILLTFLVDESMAQKYYRILMMFNQTYGILYHLNLLNLIVELLCLIPLFLFTFHIRWLPAIVWQILFEARIVFFLASHSYEWKTLSALAHADGITTIAATLIFTIFVLPSYIAVFHYAFKRDRLLS